jgi:hypothetical protein
MSLVDLSVERIDIRNVPKFVLFGGDEAAGSDDGGAEAGEAKPGGLPVSIRTVLLVSIGATLVAFLAAKAASIVGEDLNLHC